MNKNLSEILSKLTLSDAKTTAKNILRMYGEKKHCIVHFLYFANIILNELNENPLSLKTKGFSRALLGGDFLLPDGIALALLYKKYFGKNLPNLNGTDFLRSFLSSIPKGKHVEILLYGATDEAVRKSAHYLEETFRYPVISVQNGFGEFDWSAVKPREKESIRILLVARGTPLQETWVESNRGKIEEMECLTFTVGGLLGFWAGSEKRAPKWMRKIKMEWLYRAISDPKKNLKKTLVSLQIIKFLIGK